MNKATPRACHRFFPWRALTYMCLLMGCTLASATGQPRGYISNESGKNCAYIQITTQGVKYFHSIPGNYSRLTFDDPACMKDTGLGLDINKMMINNILARWYSHPNAAFATLPSQLRRTSVLQVRGQCMQSATYPIIGVAIEYHIMGNSITSVSHAATAGGCVN